MSDHEVPTNSRCPKCGYMTADVFNCTMCVDPSAVFATPPLAHGPDHAQARERIARDVARWRTRTMTCNCLDATCQSCKAWEEAYAEVKSAFAAPQPSVPSGEAVAEPWVIHLKEGANDCFWRENRSGYSGDLMGAGLYTEAEAKACATRAIDTAMPLSEAIALRSRNGKELRSNTVAAHIKAALYAAPPQDRVSEVTDEMIERVLAMMWETNFGETPIYERVRMVLKTALAPSRTEGTNG
jgi:hypothetical protein